MEVAALGIRIDSDGVPRAIKGLDDLSAAAGRAERATDGLQSGSRQANRAMAEMDRAARNSATGMANLAQSVARAGVVIGAALSVTALKRYADGWSDMQSQVGAAIKNMEAAPQMMRRIVDIANASYSPLQQTVDIYTRNVQVLRDLGMGADKAADFTEALNHSLVITATKGEQAASVQNALTRAMSVGKMSGMDLNTVLTYGGRIAESLARELGTTVNGLREMAAQGRITSDVIAQALLGSLEDVRREAGAMPATIGDAFTRVQTNITELVGRLDKAAGASSAVADVILKAADAIRTTGDYMLAFGALAAPAFDAVGAAVGALAQYADIALAAVAGFAAPAAIAGVWALAAALSTGVAGAIKTITLAMLANPIGLIVGALTAAGYAAYKFRDEIEQAIGVDVVDIAKRAGNLLMGSFAAAYEGIKFTWNNFGDILGAAVIGGVNSAIRGINSLIEKAVAGINAVIDAANKIPMVSISPASASGLSEIANPYADRLVNSSADAAHKIRMAMEKDYIGAIGERIRKAREAATATADLAGATNRSATASAEASKALKKLSDERAKWSESIVDAGKKEADALAKATAKMREQLDLLGKSDREIAKYRSEKLLTAAAANQHAAAELDAAAALLQVNNVLPEVARSYRQMADARREAAEELARQAQLTIDIADRQDEVDAAAAAKKAGDAAEAEWRKTADGIQQTLTDALMRGFESGKGFARNMRDAIVNMFQTLVLRPILMPVIGGAMGALGMAGTAQAGTSVMGMAGSANSIISAITGGYAAGIGSVAGMFGGDAIMATVGAKTGLAGSVGMGGSALAGGAISSIGGAIAGEALNKFISSGYSISKGVDTVQTIGTVAASIFAGPLGGVIGGAISGAMNALFGRKLKDSGIEGTFGDASFAGQQYQYLKGGLFRSNKTKRADLDPELQDALSGQFAALQYATAGMADTLGLGAEAIQSYTSTVKISLKGLKEDAANERIAEEFQRMGEEMAALLPGLQGFAKHGEAAQETLARLSTSLLTVNQAFDTLGLMLAEGLGGGDFASILLESIGGPDAFGQAVGQYFEGYYTEAERIQTVTRQLTEQMAGLGLALPDTRDGFRAMVEAARDAGDPQTLAALLQLSPAFASITQSADDLARTAQESAEAIAQSAAAAAQAVAQERAGLERQLLEAMGDKAGLRALDLSALDASNRALQERIWAIQDARAAEADAAQRVAAQMQAAAAQMQAVAQQRYQIETRLLTLQGDTAALRARELELLDPSNRAMQEEIWRLEDQQKRAQAAAQASAQAAAAAARVRDEWSRLTQSVFDEVRRIRGELYGSGAVGYAQAQQQFAIAAVQARAGDKGALESLPMLSRQMLDLAEENATSLLELQRMRSYTVGALLGAGNAAAMQRGVATFAPTPGVNGASSDPALLAAINDMRRELARIAETNEKSAPYIERTARVLDDAQRGKAPLATETTP